LKLYFINRFFYPDISASSQMLTDLTTALASDFPITVVTSRKLYNDPSAKLERCGEIKGVEILRLDTTRMGRDTLWRRAIDYVSFHLRVFLFLLGRVRKGDLVVLKTDPPLLSLLNTTAIRFGGGQVVNWQQDLFPEIAMELGAFPRNRMISRPLLWWRNCTLRMAKTNVTVSQHQREYLAEQGVCNTRYIPNWADGNLIRPMAHADNPLRKQWNPENKFLVGYSGNFGRAHSFDELLEAMMLLETSREIQFLLIGEGVRLDPLKGAIERKHLHHVSFHPYQPHDILRQSLGAIDLHLVTLKENMEGLVLPSKIYGVLAAGRPIAFVGDKDGEIAGLIHESEVGFAVGHGDGAGLAEQIRLLARNPEKLRQMGVNARQLFDDEYAKPRSVRLWRNLMTELNSV
jgi:glycosyltransferase involved in cell wall biosynthesis